VVDPVLTSSTSVYLMSAINRFDLVAEIVEEARSMTAEKR
jgi:hypothetical protein